MPKPLSQNEMRVVEEIGSPHRIFHSAALNPAAATEPRGCQFQSATGRPVAEATRWATETSVARAGYPHQTEAPSYGRFFMQCAFGERQHFGVEIYGRAGHLIAKLAGRVVIALRDIRTRCWEAMLPCDGLMHELHETI